MLQLVLGCAINCEDKERKLEFSLLLLLKIVMAKRES